jgi:hypothetical protein
VDRPGMYEVALLTDRTSDGKQLWCFHLVAHSRDMAIQMAKREITEDCPEDWFKSIKACAFYHNDGIIRVFRRGRPTSEFRVLEARCKQQQREEEQLA